MKISREPSSRSLRDRLVRLFVFGSVVAAVFLAGLFLANGLILAPGEMPVRSPIIAEPRRLPNSAKGVEVRILAYNIAEAFAYRQHLQFAGRNEIEERLAALAEVINGVDPDLVFLSEVLHECPPCGRSQVEFLAKTVGAHRWLFGECYNVGLPFYRVPGGNVILSRVQLAAEANLTLPGRKPFYVSANNRRALFGLARIGNAQVLLGSLHNDSRGGDNNVAQMRAVLDHSTGRPTILAGDFNARPGSKSLDLLRDSGRFTRIVADQLTHPARKPDRTIDYILVPAEWELLEYRVLKSTVSDHRPVFARVRCPNSLCG